MSGKYFTIVILVTITKLSTQVYVPYDEIDQKPVRYSSGIKTTPEVEYHHNYSGVYYQNSANYRNLGYQQEVSSESPPVSERQIYVINGTKIPETQNPLRRILIYNKVNSGRRIEVYRTCPRNATGHFVYESSCNQFLNCWKGRGYVQNCAPGTLFNPKSSECDYPHKVSCVSGPRRTILQRERSAKPPRQVGCPKEFSGLIPNYTDCSKFINCVGGIENFMDCPRGTLFDVDRNICDFADKASCFGSAARNIDGKLDFESRNTRNHKRTRSSYKFGGVRCPDHANGLFKHPTDCSKFLNCAEGQTHVQDCAPGTLFNHALRICDFPYNVRCENNSPASGDLDGSPTSSSYYHNVDQGSNYGDWPRQNSREINQNANLGYEKNRDDDGNQSGHYGNPYYDRNRNQTTYYIPGRYGTSANQYSPDYSGKQNTNNYYGFSTTYYRPIQENNLNRSGVYNTGGYYDGRLQINRQDDRTTGLGQDYQSSVNSNQNYRHDSNHYDPSYQSSYSNQYDNGQNYYHQRPLSATPTDRQPGNFLNNKQNVDYYYNRNQNSENNFNPTTIHTENQDWHNHRSTGIRTYNVYPNQYDYVSRSTQRNFLDEDGSRTNQKVWTRQKETATPNYDQIVNINQIRKTTRVPFRNSYEPFFGSTSRSIDHDDTFNPNHNSGYVRVTTPRGLEKHWPPPFPSTDVNADYVFEYEDNDGVGMEAENAARDDGCGKSHFRCSSDKCIPKTLVCDSVKDCPNGQDELKCLEYVSGFSVRKNHKLAVLEKERWNNVSIATCALLCVRAEKLGCRSFNYRRLDRTCLLTNTNEGLTGAVIRHEPFDYYELISERIDCGSMFVCSNKKCIGREKICDGQDDCGDRKDEKGCKPRDFGYTVRLVDSGNRHEGHVQVTAFGKTGYICDDNFGLRDADVVCRELGFALGSVEVKKNSFYENNSTGGKTFYMMDDVMCVGNETSLMDCDFNGWGVHNCLSQEKVGVVCKTPQEKCPDDYWQCNTQQECLPLSFVCDGLLDCTDGSDENSQHCDAPTEIRLVNGTNGQEGRVEIRHHGVWGTVCDDDFNEDAAKVICKQLGFAGPAYVRKDGHFGAGSGPIWLDQVFCSGNETSVERCAHWNWGEHNCEHDEDVGVVCGPSFAHERHSVSSIRHDEYPERCGFRKDDIFDRHSDIHARVVRGSVARRGDYPWQAAVRVKGKNTDAHWCGAVIIAEKFVLTAAHCLVGYSKGAYLIVAGDYNVDEDEGTEQQAYIEDFYIHDKFREDHKMNNDIALVKLKGRGFRFNDDVKPICLPDADTNYEIDLNCTISGFGSIQSGKSAFSHMLRAGWIPLQKREICTMPHVYGEALTDGMICAGSLDEGIDSCDGDSGGPLACLHGGVFTLYGITSWGQHCGYANKPGVYVKVAHYRRWIDDNFYKHSSK